MPSLSRQALTCAQGEPSTEAGWGSQGQRQTPLTFKGSRNGPWPTGCLRCPLCIFIWTFYHLEALWGHLAASIMHTRKSPETLDSPRTSNLLWPAQCATLPSLHLTILPSCSGEARSPEQPKTSPRLSVGTKLRPFTALCSGNDDPVPLGVEGPAPREETAVTLGVILGSLSLRFLTVKWE